MRISLRGLMLATMFCCLFLASCQWTVGPVIPDSKLRKIKAGMTKQEVESALGSWYSEFDERWEYSRVFNPGWVSIYFDRYDCVSHVDDECVFP